MKNFKEWLKEKDQELYEGIIKSLANSKLARKMLTAGAIAAGGYGLTKKFDIPNVISNIKDEDDNISNMEKQHSKLLAAAKRAGVPKSEWGKLKGEARGGVVIKVNNRKVPLTQKEKETVKAATELARRMGNNW